MAANSNLLKNIDPGFMGYEAVIVYHFRHARSMDQVAAILSYVYIVKLIVVSCHI